MKTMRRILATACAAFMTAGIFTGASALAVFGYDSTDVNRDGVSDYADSIKVYRNLRGLEYTYKTEIMDVECINV